ncbi:MAG: hypothetical protein JWN56_2969 [Sphingobacteriales bacterium]|nr:hypothetical protein [Sphingobacteriales bacterium]
MKFLTQNQIKSIPLTSIRNKCFKMVDLIAGSKQNFDFYNLKGHSIRMMSLF